MRQLKIATQITNRDSQAVEKYLQEISKISMITPEERDMLHRQMAQAYAGEATRELLQTLRAKTKIKINKNLL